MSIIARTKRTFTTGWALGLGILLMGLLVACGASSPAGETDAGTASQPTATQQLAKPEALAIPATAAPAAAGSGGSGVRARSC